MSAGKTGTPHVAPRVCLTWPSPPAHPVLASPPPRPPTPRLPVSPHLILTAAPWSRTITEEGTEFPEGFPLCWGPHRRPSGDQMPGPARAHAGLLAASSTSRPCPVERQDLWGQADPSSSFHSPARGLWLVFTSLILSFLICNGEDKTAPPIGF